MSSIDYEKLFRFLFEVPLWEELNRAERGDEEAARNVLGAIAFLTSTKNVHPNTGEVLPVPGFVRDYLSRAFGRMAAGVSPDKALHLNQGKKGRSPDSYSRKILAASIVEYLHRFHELPVDQACSKAEEVIGGIIEAPQIRCSLGAVGAFSRQESLQRRLHPQVLLRPRGARVYKAVTRRHVRLVRVSGIALSYGSDRHKAGQ